MPGEAGPTAADMGLSQADMAVTTPPQPDAGAKPPSTPSQPAPEITPADAAVQHVQEASDITPFDAPTPDAVAEPAAAPIDVSTPLADAAVDDSVPPATTDDINAAETTEPAADDTATTDSPTESGASTESEGTVQERVENASVEIINAQIMELNIATKGMTTEQRNEYLQNPNNAGENALDSARFLLELPEDMHGESEIRFSATDRPVKIRQGDKVVTIRSIQKVDAGADTFDCKVVDADGNESLATGVPRQDVVQANIVSERAAILKEIPSHQKALVDKYIDHLSAKIYDTEDPLATASERELKELDEILEKAKDPESREQRLLRQSGALYTPGYEDDAVRLYDRAFPRQFSERVNKAMEAEKERLGKGRFDRLSADDKLLIKLKVIGEIQRENADATAWTNGMESTFRQWESNFIAGEGRKPRPEEAEAYKGQLKFWESNRDQLGVLLNEAHLKEMHKKLNKKERAAILLIFAGFISKQFAEPLMPTAN